MAQDPVFRHPYEELRRMTAFPLAQVVVLGSGEAYPELMERLHRCKEVEQVVTRGTWGEQTRLVIADRALAEAGIDAGVPPPPRTCVVWDLGVHFPADERLPLPGMCLRGLLHRSDEGALCARLEPEAATVPEALELVAELLYALGIPTDQRPVDRSPGVEVDRQ